MYLRSLGCKAGKYILISDKKEKKKFVSFHYTYTPHNIKINLYNQKKNRLPEIYK